MGADAEVISFREECVTELRPGRPAPKKRERLPPLSKQDRIARKAVAQKYAYGDAITRKDIRAVPNKKLKRTLLTQESLARSVHEKAVRAELLLTEQPGFIETEGLEKSYRIRQADLVACLDRQNADKVFDLSLDLGPYSINYSRNGNHLLLGGRKGHIALMDWNSFKLESEIFVNETVRDVKFLHNHTMHAVAQKKYVYIYDNKGIEIHCLRNHIDVNRIDFLPYHFLLLSIGKSGYLKYQDVSTGAIVCEHRTRKGPSDVLAHNPTNAVVHVGHSKGVVTLWTPNITTPVVTMLCHKGPVQAVAIGRDGYTMATSGSEGRVAIWDLRTYGLVKEWRTFAPAHSIDISQSGLMALGVNSELQILKDNALYMTHQIHGSHVDRVRFCPHNDVLGIGHSSGFSSIVVPGSGEANYDAFEANPFETKAQRREVEVKRLLDKLQPDMITLDKSVVGTVRPAKSTTIAREESSSDDDEGGPSTHKLKLKNKRRGRSASSKKWALRKLKAAEAKGSAPSNPAGTQAPAPSHDETHVEHVLDRFK
ncbi:BING4 C-terminal domain-containing protein [Plasmodiophora brassicae]